jgi:anti-sigma-K factor RskA
MMKHEIAYELLEDYVFGVLDAPEREQLEAHLDGGCADCDARISELGVLSVQMAEALPQQDVPASVKAGLLARVREDNATSTAAAVASGPSTADIVSGFAKWTRIAWGTAAVSLAAAGFMFWQVQDLRNDVTYMNKLLNVSATETQRLQTELADAHKNVTLDGPGYRFVSMNGVGPNPDAFGQIVMRPDGASGVVYMYHFPEPPAGMAYQLWSWREEKVASLGMFKVASDGTAIIEMADIKDANCITRFDVTVEPEKGVPAPTGMLYVRGDNKFRDDPATDH